MIRDVNSLELQDFIIVMDLIGLSEESFSLKNLLEARKIKNIDSNLDIKLELNKYDGNFMYNNEILNGVIYICNNYNRCRIASQNPSNLIVYYNRFFDNFEEKMLVVRNIKSVGCLLDINNFDGMKKLLNFKSYKDVINNILKWHHIEPGNIKEVYIFGTGRLGIEVLEYYKSLGITISGFIDNDLSKRNKRISGINIFSLEDIDKNKQCNVIIASLSYLYDIEKQLKEYKNIKIIPFDILGLKEDHYYKSAKPLEGMQKELIKHKNKYLSLFLCFNDYLSMRIFNEIIKYRITLDISFLNNAFKLSGTAEKQYFDTSIIDFKEDEVFVDIGGYDGDTTIKFITNNFYKYKKIYLFEPDKNLFNHATKNLKNYDHIKLINKAVSENECELSFDSTGDTGGCVRNDGSEKIYTTYVDKAIDDDASFIKIDSEGFEKKIIIGARNSIIMNRPKLAIAAYHNCFDMWDIVEAIWKYRNDYKIYLRHYTNTCFDTDLYFL